MAKGKIKNFFFLSFLFFLLFFPLRSFDYSLNSRLLSLNSFLVSFNYPVFLTDGSSQGKCDWKAGLVPAPISGYYSGGCYQCSITASCDACNSLGQGWRCGCWEKSPGQVDYYGICRGYEVTANCCTDNKCMEKTDGGCRFKRGLTPQQWKECHEKHCFRCVYDDESESDCITSPSSANCGHYGQPCTNLGCFSDPYGNPLVCCPLEDKQGKIVKRCLYSCPQCIQSGTHIDECSTSSNSERCKCCSQICWDGVLYAVGSVDNYSLVVDESAPLCCEQECKTKCATTKKIVLADCITGKCNTTTTECGYQHCCATTKEGYAGCFPGECEPGATTSCGTCGVKVCKDDCTWGECQPDLSKCSGDCPVCKPEYSAYPPNGQLLGYFCEAGNCTGTVDSCFCQGEGDIVAYRPSDNTPLYLTYNCRPCYNPGGCCVTKCTPGASPPVGPCQTPFPGSCPDIPQQVCGPFGCSTILVPQQCYLGEPCECHPEGWQPPPPPPCQPGAPCGPCGAYWKCGPNGEYIECVIPPVECYPPSTTDSGIVDQCPASRHCNKECKWEPWVVDKECTPGETRECGVCAVQVCGNDCKWGACQFVGECIPGAERSCGSCGIQTCDNKCHWSSCQKNDSLCGGECGVCQTKDNGKTYNCYPDDLKCAGTTGSCTCQQEGSNWFYCAGCYPYGCCDPKCETYTYMGQQRRRCVNGNPNNALCGIDGTCKSDCTCEYKPPPPSYHNECTTDKKCVSVAGPGTDQCQSDADCTVIPPSYHNECTTDKKCVSVAGPGTDQCQSDADCTVIPPPPPPPPSFPNWEWKEIPPFLILGILMVAGLLPESWLKLPKSWLKKRKK